MSRSRSSVVVLMCAIAAFGVSACGSSSKSSSTAASTSASTSTPSTASSSTPSTASTTAASSGTAATGTPISVGSICSCSGIEAAALADNGKVTMAWAEWVNAHGGINGHPVKMTVLDDGSSPATALQDAKQLVEEDHIIAMVGDVSLVDGSFAPYLKAQGIPILGSDSTATSATDPDLYPAGTPLLGLIIGTVGEAKGKNLGGMYCAESPVCAQLVPLLTGVGKLFGVKVETEKVAAAAPSYAAQCLALKGDGANALYVADNGAVVERVIANCQQLGYTPVDIIESPTTTNALLRVPGVQGSLVPSVTANPYDASLPAIKTFQDAINRYYPGMMASASFSYNAIYSWAPGLLFQAAAKAGDIGPTSTSADVKKGLYALKGETLGGVAPPLTYTPGKPFFSACWFTDKVSNNTLVTANGDKPTCLAAAQIAELLKAIG